MWGRFVDLFRRRRLDADLESQLAHHLNALEAEYRARGLAPGDARAAARRDMGGLSQVRDAYRDQHGVPVFETIWRNSRFAVRALRRTPGLTATIVLTLALGIGANSAVFSTIDTVLLRPLSFPDADELVRVIQTQDKLLVGQEQAEALKVEIGSALADVEVPDFADIAGRDLVTGLLRRTSIDATTVRSALERPLAQIVDAVKDLLERTPPELASDVADRGLMLVGGGALLRGLDQRLQRETGLHVTVADDPLTTVARGAGQALEELATLRARADKPDKPRFGH